MAQQEAEKQAEIQAEKDALMRLSENESTSDIFLVVQSLYSRIEELEKEVEQLRDKVSTAAIKANVAQTMSIINSANIARK